MLKQSYQTEWENAYINDNSDANEFANDIFTDRNGNSYIVFSLISSTSVNLRGVKKLDNQGNKLWITLDSFFNAPGNTTVFCTSIRKHNC